MPGDAFAESDSHVADLAKERAVTGDFLDDRGFAKAHFAESLTDVGRSVQRAYATSRPGGELGEGHTRTLESRIGVHVKLSYD